MPNFSEIWQFCELSNLNLCAQPHNGILALDIIARTIARTYSLHMPWLRSLCLVYLLGDVFVSVIPPSHWVGGQLRRQCRRLMQKVVRSTHSVLCFTNHECNIEFSEHKCTAIDINDKQHHRHIIIERSAWRPEVPCSSPQGVSPLDARGAFTEDDDGLGHFQISGCI